MITTEKLIEALEGTDFKVESYSGRCMYGAHCAAIIADHVSVLVSIGARLATTEGITYTEVLNFADSTHTDSMGRGVVMYWPSLKVTRESHPDLYEDEDDEGEDY